jgi:hypothetical protein
MLDCDDDVRKSIANALDPMRKIVDCMKSVDKSNGSFTIEDDGNGGIKRVPMEKESECDNSFVDVRKDGSPLTVRELYAWARDYGYLDRPIKFHVQNSIGGIDTVGVQKAYRELDYVMVNR